MKWTMMMAALMLPLVMSCSDEFQDGDSSQVSGQGDELITFSLSQNDWNRINTSSTKSESDAVTRSEPITTQNLGSLYKSFAVTAFPTKKVGDECVYFQDEASPRSASWNTTQNHYWPLNSALDFYAYAPVENSGRTNMEFKYVDSKQLISFEYALPNPDTESRRDAEHEQDLLFAITKNYNKSMAMSAKDKGAAPLEFHHALSAIYFQKASSDDGKIKSISLENIHSSGSCVFDGEHFTWTDVASSALETYSQSFDIPVSGNETQEITFYNDESGKRAFMMIPQELSMDESKPAKLKVVFEETGGETKEMYAEIHGLTPQWLPGKAYTYRLTIKSGEVFVDVVEEFNKHTKEDVVVMNTGDRNSYFRVAILANWLDSEGNVVKACDWMTEGVVENPGWGKDEKWNLLDDGFFYYKNAVRKRKLNSGSEYEVVYTDNLFKSYTAPIPPKEGLDLEMIIIAQAVDYDQNKAAVKESWGDAAYSFYSDVVEEVNKTTREFYDN